jgi:hypothetical protein
MGARQRKSKVEFREKPVQKSREK